VNPPDLPEGLDLSPSNFRLMTLINSGILLLLAVTIGTLIKDSVGICLPILDPEEKNPWRYTLKALFYPFLMITLVAVFGVWAIFQGLYWGFDSNYRVVINGPGLPFLTRLLYGGITEEILMRYGLMTILLWILKEINRPNSQFQFWIANVLTAMLFATGHLPALFNEVPSPSSWTLLYILSGNIWAGLCFGFAFWRYGLILAILTHMGFHIVTYFII
jgi:hypothetical protein